MIQTANPQVEGAVLNAIMGRRIFNYNKNFLCVVTGSTGCLSGDTIINTNRNELGRPYTIKFLYNVYNGIKNYKCKGWDLSKPTYVRSFNGEIIRLNKLKNVFYSGKKEVYCLHLENGLSIKATADHKFLTKNNEWLELSKLNNQEIMCDTLNAESSNRKRIKLRDIGLGVGKNHPYNIQPNKQIPVHTLIYEARMNNLEFLEYIDILLNEPERCKELKYINPSLKTIHHKDGCHYNNSIDNLELLDRQEHYYKHNEYTNFSQGIPKFSKVLRIEYVGEEDTYDIECEEPNHNFVANGIVVHNSGKSMCDLRIAELWYKHTFKKQFPIDHCCFSLDELLGLLASGKLVKGDLLILEEAGVSMGALDFQNKISKMFNYVLQTFRSKNIILLVNLPHFQFLNKTMRMLMHCKMEMQSIDFANKKSYVKTLFIETNAKTGKIWYQYPKLLIGGTWEKIMSFNYSLPSEELRIEYEKKKDDFVNGVTRRVLKEIDMANQKTDKELGLPVIKSEIQKKIWETLTKNPNKYNQTELAKLLSIKNVASVSDSIEFLEKKGYNPRFYLKKRGFGLTKVALPPLIHSKSELP